MRKFTGLFVLSVIFSLLIIPVKDVGGLQVNTGDSQRSEVNTETTNSNSSVVLRNRDRSTVNSQRNNISQANESQDVRVQQDNRPGNSTEERGNSCQSRSHAVEKIMDRQYKRGEKYVELFSTISERVQDFHDGQSFETNDEYEAAVAKTEKEHENATGVLDDLNSSKEKFDCEEDNPKELVSSYVDDLKKLLSALKSYKSSVVDLIKVVQATAEENNEESQGETTNSNPFSRDENDDSEQNSTREGTDNE